MVRIKCSREANKWFGTEDHEEKIKYIETISIDNVHIILNDFVFAKHLWCFLRPTILAFDFLLPFWRREMFVLTSCLFSIARFYYCFLVTNFLEFCSHAFLLSNFFKVLSLLNT